MKIVVIGDIHGHDSWQRVLNHEKSFDKVIFLGTTGIAFQLIQKTRKRTILKFRNFEMETLIK